MIRPPVKIHGGKFYTKKLIIDSFPKDYQSMIYVEGCGGAGSVILNKLPSIQDVYNDLDSNMYNIFRCLKNYPKEMLLALNKIPYTEESFKAQYSNTSIDKAIKEIILRRMSRGGMKKTFSWSKRLRGGRPGDENAWLTFISELPKTIERIKNIEVMNQNVLSLIDEKDSTNTLFYIDPPYLASTRSAKSVYDIEMSEEDHIALGKKLNNCSGKVILSGYMSDLYKEMFKDWRLIVKEIANHASQSKIKQRKFECLWCNY